MVNPFIVCTWTFILSLLYPIHGITTFPLNVLCVGGIMGTKFNELTYGTFYSIFSHIGPFFWVPWTITVESVILCVGTFVIYSTLMNLFYKDPYEYYIENAQDSRKEFMKNITVFVRVVVVPVVLLLSGYLLLYLPSSAKSKHSFWH